MNAFHQKKQRPWIPALIELVLMVDWIMFKDGKIRYSFALGFSNGAFWVFSVQYSLQLSGFGGKNLYRICVKLQNISGLDLLLYSYAFPNFLFITLCIIGRQDSLTNYRGHWQTQTATRHQQVRVSRGSSLRAAPQKCTHNLFTIADPREETRMPEPTGQCVEGSPCGENEKAKAIHGWIYWPYC